MYKIITFPLIVFIFFNCKSQPKKNFTENDIEQFFLHKQRDTMINNMDTIYVSVKEYIVNNFVTFNDSVIARFIQKELKKETQYYDQIVFSFYKHSKTTNKEYLKESPKYFDLYAALNDAIYNASRDVRYKVFTLNQIKQDREYGKTTTFPVQ